MNESLDQYPHPQLVRWKSLPVVLALLAFAIGAAALFGWILNNDFLKRIHPSLVTIKANTAVCLMLTALAVLLVRDRSASTARRRASQLCAVVVASVGLITFSEHLLGWDAGIDQLLFFESQHEAGLSFPGRMGVAASLDFFFLGMALLFLDVRSRWVRLSNILVMMVVAITLLVFLYYFYGIDRTDPVTY